MCKGTNTFNKDKAFPCALIAFDAFFMCLSTAYFTSTLMTVMLFPCSEESVLFRVHAPRYFYPTLSLSHAHLCIFVCILMPSPS